MRKILTIVVYTLFVLLYTNAFAQENKSQFDPKTLQLQYEITDGKYENKPQTLAMLTLTNTGKVPLPASGWTLYFHSFPALKPKTDNAPVKVEHVNGDLRYIAPTAAFKELAPGASQRIELVSGGQVVNDSRTPHGFYLVWDQDKSKGYATAQITVKKPDQPWVDWVQAKDIYEQNKIITNIPEEKLTKVFPTPAVYHETGKPFTMTATVPIVTDAAFMREADLLADHFGDVFGKKPVISMLGTGKAIRLQQKKGLGPEAYELQVSPQEVVIAASTPAGAFYGTQSLKTLIPAEALTKKQSAVSLPGLRVSDEPRFGHRAFMMDVARNFQTKEQVLKVLDLMALYKLNVLHFHLNDDEGWRLEIPGLPELTEVGSKRGHTVDEKNHMQPSLGSGPDADKTSGSGHYTKADYIEILKYATERHIKVIPEIETPGHARAAIKSMDARYARLMQEGKPEEAKRYLLRDLNDKSEYRSVQNWNDNVIDVALPSTYTFLEKVVDEMLAMYKEAGAPIQTIHMGGDEVPAGVWEKSPAVQALLAANPKVKSKDDLWDYFFGKVNDMLAARKLYLSGWEEIGLTKVKQNGKSVYVPNPDFKGKNFHVDVWNNLWGAEDLAYRMANAGYKVVLTNASNLYLDLTYQKAYEEPGLYWAGYLDLDKPFYFIPFDYMKNQKVDTDNKPINPAVFKGKEQLTAYGRTNIVGLQAPLWSEMIKTPERLEYMLLPKLLGLAERAWAPDPAWATESDAAKGEAAYNQAWSAFVNVLGKRELPRLSHYAGGFQYRIPTAGAVVENGKVLANVQLPGFTIRYTTDGSEPTEKSKVYTGPISEKGEIKLKVFAPSGRSGRVVTVGNKAS
ncbi:family 20 glycosylhydrolase [Pontibacter virosus]|uniref:beta-N-acetylhexosaminidase n=1 Tax=Pontibacter virosus TaxID=1765052 RepID=A0A2U1B167_9BACT|nr:family 20 glycosylhydrolase [Pontibacter virosus]PVY42331.1 hexosaminidase [Pontibacter virosus]